MTQKIRVAVVDQHPLFRDGIIVNLKAQPDVEVIGHGTTIRDVLRLAREGEPDVIVLDMSLKTVKHHITNILQKLQVRNRVEAALVASERVQQRLTLS
jgi:DNA-binding NarL/FixJ family response regulator